MNQNVGIWSRERFIAGPSKENRWLGLKRPALPNGFKEEFLKAKFGVRAGGCMTSFWLVVR